MTRLDFVHYFELPLDEFIRMCFQPTEEEINDLTDLPNVKEREEVERYEDDKVVRTVVRYFAIGFIPPEVRKWLKPHMLSWLEHSSYYKEGKYWEWRIEPHFFKNMLDCRGKMSLHADGARTKRITKGHIDIKLPLVGHLGEKLIIDHLKQNFAAENKMFHDTLRRAREKKQQAQSSG